MPYIAVASKKIKGKNDITVGYEIGYIHSGNTHEASNSEGNAKLSIQQVKDLIQKNNFYFVNLQIDKAGRLVKKAIDPNDLIDKLGELWSVVAQNTIILYAHDHEKEAIEVIKNYYNDVVKAGHASDLFKGDCKWMVNLVKSGDIDNYNYDTQGRERFQNLMIEKLLKIKNITPYWQLSDRHDRNESNNKRPIEKMEIKTAFEKYVLDKVRNDVLSFEDKEYADIEEGCNIEFGDCGKDIYEMCKLYNIDSIYDLVEKVDDILRGDTLFGNNDNNLQAYVFNYEFGTCYIGIVASTDLKKFVECAYKIMKGYFEVEEILEHIDKESKEQAARITQNPKAREMLNSLLFLKRCNEVDWFEYDKKSLNNRAVKAINELIEKISNHK